MHYITTDFSHLFPISSAKFLAEAARSHFTVSKVVRGCRRIRLNIYAIQIHIRFRVPYFPMNIASMSRISLSVVSGSFLFVRKVTKSIIEARSSIIRRFMRNESERCLRNWNVICVCWVFCFRFSAFECERIFGKFVEILYAKFIRGCKFLKHNLIIIRLSYYKSSKYRIIRHYVIHLLLM